MTKVFLKNSAGKFIVSPTTCKFIYRSVPDTYTELEYLQSTGTQYIDTGVIGNLNTDSEVKFKPIAYSTNQTFLNYGYAGNYIQPNLALSGARNSRFGDKVLGIGTFVYLNGEYVLRINKTNLMINGSVVGTFNTTTEFTTPATLLLGIARNIDSSYYNGTNQFYYCKIWDNGTLIRYFVPVKRNSDNVLGMYDIVNNVFYTNAGTGTFTAGPRIPSEYQEVEYIQSSGTQYINSEFIDSPKTRVVIDMQFTTTSPTQQRLFGHGYDADTGTNVTFDCYINGSTQWARGTKDGAGNWQSTNISADTSRHTFDLDLVSNTYKIYTNGTLIHSSSNNYTITRTNTDVIWILHSTGSTNTSHYARAKLYSCKIYDYGALVRNFIPCYRKSDNVIGMYDTVEDKFYTNSGTGSFTKGSNV